MRVNGPGFAWREDEAAFAFNLKGQARLGHSFKDWLCPDAMEFQADCFRLDGRWGRALYLQGYASYIKDSLVSELCGLDRSLMLSIDLLPVPTDEAVKEIQNKLLGLSVQNYGASTAAIPSTKKRTAFSLKSGKALCK